MDGDWFSFSLVSRFCFRFLGIGLLANGLFLSFFLLSFRSSKVFAFPDILQAKQKKNYPLYSHLPTHQSIYLSIHLLYIHPSIFFLCFHSLFSLSSPFVFPLSLHYRLYRIVSWYIISLVFDPYSIHRSSHPRGSVTRPRP